jgi:uncharacterized damage-inducible protein DinB
MPVETLLALTTLSGTLAAQEMKEMKEMKGMNHEQHGGVSAARQVYEGTRGFLIKSAEQMPDADYGFKPVATVRTFGQILGHLANENFEFCASALGEKSPAAGQDFEKTTDKAGMIKAIKDAMSYCDRAYQLSEMASMGQTELFGMKGSKLWVLIFNASHDAEHYGNLVTYFRIKGMVPPSSQPSGM